MKEKCNSRWLQKNRIDLSLVIKIKLYSRLIPFRFYCIYVIMMYFTMWSDNHNFKFITYWVLCIEGNHWINLFIECPVFIKKDCLEKLNELWNLIILLQNEEFFGMVFEKLDEFCGTSKFWASSNSLHKWNTLTIVLLFLQINQ